MKSLMSQLSNTTDQLKHWQENTLSKLWQSYRANTIQDLYKCLFKGYLFMYVCMYLFNIFLRNAKYHQLSLSDNPQKYQDVIFCAYCTARCEH